MRPPNQNREDTEVLPYGWFRPRNAIPAKAGFDIAESASP